MAADLNVVDTQAKRQASRGVVKEITAAIQPSGNTSIPVISTKAEKEWTVALLRGTRAWKVEQLLWKLEHHPRNLRGLRGWCSNFQGNEGVGLLLGRQSSCLAPWPRLIDMSVSLEVEYRHCKLKSNQFVFRFYI
ncbi:hypothetical protein LWI29_021506 [Acer saccharum]|uniref:Uncharacterized protein n=1 Tax=Acer saccharum TaxID=4024 RepID=A0AA39RQX5_ACESA|nr:hypothetical protein LWI29_021506 [Acer saccharum]